MFRLCSGFVHSQVLLGCVRLELFDGLASGPRSTASIAEDAGLSVDRLRHLLRAAAALKLLQRRGEDSYGLGVLGASLADNESLRALIEHHSLFYEDLVEPLALYSQSPPSTRMSTLWPYAQSSEPDALAQADVSNYTALMASSQTMVAEQVIAAYPLKDVTTLMDIGGGAGVFAKAVARRWKHLSVTIADLPAVAELAQKGLEGSEFGDRLTAVGIDATTGSLPGNFDVVTLVRILHDHDDERALSMLRSARAALKPDGVLLIAEPMADAPGAGPLIDAYFHVYLLSMGSGRPRSAAELGALAATAGFGPLRRHRTRVPLITSVLSAGPA